MSRSWGQGPNNPPKPDWPPQKSRAAKAEERLVAWLARVLTVPVPAVWDGKGVRP